MPQAFVVLTPSVVAWPPNFTLNWFQTHELCLRRVFTLPSRSCLDWPGPCLVLPPACASACPCPSPRTRRATPARRWRCGAAARGCWTCRASPSPPRTRGPPSNGPSPRGCCCARCRRGRGCPCPFQNSLWSTSRSWKEMLEPPPLPRPLAAPQRWQVRACMGVSCSPRRPCCFAEMNSLKLALGVRGCECQRVSHAK